MTRRALTYARVSTERQGESGLGLDAQRSAMTVAVEARGWELVGELKDVASGKSLDRRPRLEECLAVLDAGEADVLVVSKLDRLSRSLIDFATLMIRAKRGGWSILALDVGIDTTTVNGELVANIMMSLAQWERARIIERITDALAEAKDRGTKLGRPSGVTDETRAAIVAMRGEGKSWRAIAAALDEAKIPTAQGPGKSWQPAAARKIHERTVTDEH